MEPELYELAVGTRLASNGAVLPGRIAVFVLEFLNRDGYLDGRHFTSRRAAAVWEEQRGPDVLWAATGRDRVESWRTSANGGS